MTVALATVFLCVFLGAGDWVGHFCHQGVYFMNSCQPIIHMQDVVKVYSTAAGDFTALKSINLQVKPGEFVGIVGKSGAGKSTLLNMVTGVDHLTSGEVIVNTDGSPVSIHKMNEDAIANWRGHNLGVMYQSFQLYPC
jgi:putative ABC transport system ATP-binding protein